MNGMTARPLEVLLHHWPTVCARAESPWAKSFAASISKQARRRNWTPTPKQLGIMRRMVSELFTSAQESADDAGVVLDDE